MLNLVAVLVAFQAVSTYAAAAPYAFATNANRTLNLTQLDPPVKGQGNANGLTVISLSMDDTLNGARQVVDGFGAAVTDSTLYVYNSLSTSRQQDFINAIASPSGANFTLLRHTIASSDLTPQNYNKYTYDDNGGSPDATLTNFNLTTPGSQMASLLAAFRKTQQALTILGSSWHPPTWMKNVSNPAGYALNPAYNQTFADYFVKYLQAYEKAGAHIDAVTIQNEPLNPYNPVSMRMSQENQTYLINNNVGPAFKNASLTTKIWVYDHNTDVPGYPSYVLTNAANYTQTAAWHCYQSPTANWTVLSAFRANFTAMNRNVDQYMSECWTHNASSWTWAPSFVFGPLQNWAKGAISWPMATMNDTSLDRIACNGSDSCRGLITIPAGGNDFQFEIDYYLMAQFSRAMSRGSTVRLVNGLGNGINAIGSVNVDGTRSLVVQNTGSADVLVRLALNATGNTWSARVPGTSLTSWVVTAS